MTFFGLKHIGPLVQGLLIAALGLLCMLVFRNSFEKAEWYVMGCALFFYSALSPMVGAFWTGNFRKYVLLSILVFGLLGVSLWFGATKLSDEPIGEEREIQMLLAAISIFFFVMTALCFFYREVVMYVRKM